MRRIALCGVVCLSLIGALFGALAQGRALPFTSSKAHKNVKPLALASTAAPTLLFGDSTVESGLDSNSAGWAEAFPVTDQTSGTVSSISVYVSSQNKATSLIAGIYSNRNGNPGSLLTSGTLPSITAGAWNAVPVTSATITSGQYWIGLLGRGGVLYFRDRSDGPCRSQNSSQTSTTSLSSTWPTGGPTWASCPVSAYARGTAGGGTTPPPPLPPVNTVAPSVSGNAADGQTISTSNGTWQNTPSTYTYEWQDCDSSGASCTTIAGATGGQYTLASGDVGHTVRSVVTAGNAGGSSSASSAASAVVTAPTTAPSNTALPAVSGTTRQGQTVSTSNGSWSNNPASFAYKWEHCNTSGTGCSLISAATSSSYALQAGDVGDTIRSVVIATNPAGWASATSTQTAVIAAIVTAPSNTGTPTVSGTDTQGSTLTTSNGSWSGSPTSFGYQWQDCNTSGTGCAAISGAISSGYTLGSGDTGHTIRSVVTATNSGGSTPASSAQTSMVGSAVTTPSNTAAPAVSGTDTQGATLTTSNGSWSGGPTAYAYQWQDCNTSGTGCANVASATTSSYTLQASDVGDTIRSVVTASNSAGSASASSAPTATIIASGGGGGGSGYTCTQHVTTSTFASAYAGAGAGAVLCLAPGNYGSFNASSKSSMVVITRDVSAGATAPTGNATGDVNGNVTFSGANFASDADTTMDGITFTGDVNMSGSSHDITLHDSLFHQHLIIDDTSMNNANININYNMFPGDTADCINGPEGRIWVHDQSHSSTGDGVVIQNNNIGGTTSQCDGIQFGGYAAQIINNWFHDFHYAGSAHTDGIQDYGGRYEVVKGNFMYNTPDCYVSYDGTNHADVENNICVNDGTQSNGASPNDLDILGDTSSIIKHNTVVAFKDSYNNAGGCITLGSKGQSSTGTVITDNIASCLVTNSGGNSASYSENHNMWVSSGPSGTGDLHSTPTYAGGSCASLSSSQSPFCSDSWSNYLLAASSTGNNAADDGTDLGAYGPGPVTPGGPG